MADTVSATRVQQWDDQYWTEYLTESRYSESYGSDENSIIQLIENLTKKPGDSITVNFVNKLTNDAVTGNNLLEGAEEDMTQRSQRIFIDKRRNAVRIPEMEEIRSAIDLRDAARSTLKDWSLKDTERLITNALGSINGVNYTTATEAQKDAWLVDNVDRVLFGNLKGNSSSLDHSTSMLNVDSTNDKLTTASIDLMKEMALSANPKIRPIRVEKTKGRRFYVMYAAMGPFRDLKSSTAMQQAQREVVLEMENNRLFEGGDLYWNGVIIKEVEDIQSIGLLGAGAINVAPVYLCGAQSVGIAYGKRWRTRTKMFDYDDKYGVAVDGIIGVSKLVFGSGTADTDDLKDNGVVTGYFSSVPSA